VQKLYLTGVDLGASPPLAWARRCDETLPRARLMRPEVIPSEGDDRNTGRGQCDAFFVTAAKRVQPIRPLLILAPAISFGLHRRFGQMGHALAGFIQVYSRSSRLCLCNPRF